MWRRLKQWAKAVKRDIAALFIASRDSRTPWLAKAVAVGVVAYALSPFDLIPDFIPVIGLLDEVVLLPLGILLVVRLMPPELMAAFRDEAEQRAEHGKSLPKQFWGGAAVVAIWIAAIAALLYWIK